MRRSNPAARWYGEKLVGTIDLLVESGITLKVIDCVRDSRDVFCSIRAFTGGGEGFGRTAGQSEDRFLNQMADAHGRRLDEMAATPASVDRLVLRYEDFASDLPATAAKLGGWLGAEFDAGKILVCRHEHRNHFTTATVAESIGRWQRELSSSQAERLWDRLGNRLVSYGYEQS